MNIFKYGTFPSKLSLIFLTSFFINNVYAMEGKESQDQKPRRVSLSNHFNKLSNDNKDKDPYLSRVYQNARTYVDLNTTLPEGTDQELKSRGSRIKAAIYGAVVGDAMGAITESRSRETVEKNFPDGLTSFWSIHKQIYPSTSPGHADAFKRCAAANGQLWKTTDDTFFLKIVLPSALEAREKSWPLNKGMEDLAEKFAAIEPRSVMGIGGSTSDGIQKLKYITQHPEVQGPGWWKRGYFAHEINKRIKDKKEGGNGSAMRAWAMGIVFHADIKKAAEWGAMQSYLTHADPTAVAACAAMAAGVASALQEKSSADIIENMKIYAEEWETYAHKTKWEAPSSQPPTLEVPTLIQKAYEARTQHPNTFFSKLPTGGFTGKEAIAATVYIFSQYPENVMQAIYTAVHSSGPGRGTDSDTIAHMSAALVGAHAGLGTLPKNWINGIENSNAIIALAEKAAKL